MHRRLGPRLDPAGVAYSAPPKLVFSKTAHLEMLRLQNGLLRQFYSAHTGKKLEGTLCTGQPSLAGSSPIHNNMYERKSWHIHGHMYTPQTTQYTSLISISRDRPNSRRKTWYFMGGFWKTSNFTENSKINFLNFTKISRAFSRCSVSIM